MHVQDPVTGALDRLVGKIDQLAKDQQDHRSQNAADLASLSIDLQKARDEVLERVAIDLQAARDEVLDSVSALEERVAVLELAGRSTEVVHADCQRETTVPHPAPPQLVDALHGPARRAPIAVPLEIPGRGTVVAHIDPDPDADPDETMGGIVMAMSRRPGA